ncbi:GAP family protein [Micrococcus luteus]|uniref:GAP family protein n=1 Tax=Micrococcus luteus TaxID=1270 RepID=UPI0020CE4157|nr:GAP family protein [Micrococcus luteus]UTT45155.1 GAP family protein [Micrococcus luteus]
MTWSLLAAIAGLAVLDSLNPSAITVALLLSLRRLGRPGILMRHVGAYAAGIAVSMFVVGILLMLGLQVALTAIATSVPERTIDIIQLCIGVVLLVVGGTLPTRPRRRRAPTLDRSGWGLFVLGLAVTTIELTSALPYLAAIGMLTQASLQPAEWLVILAAYSLVTVAPVLVIGGAAAALGERIRPWAERNAQRFQDTGRGLILTIVFLIGLILTFDALARLEYFGLRPVQTALLPL